MPRFQISSSLMLLRFTPWSLPSWRDSWLREHCAGEAVAVARHVGMPVDLEGEVGSSSQADRSGLEVAGRGVQIDGLHVRQIGGQWGRGALYRVWCV